MLFFVSKPVICNFADDNTVSSCGKMSRNILHNLKFDLGHILKSLKPNPSKLQCMVLGTNTDIKINLFLCGNKIENLKKGFH